MVSSKISIFAAILFNFINCDAREIGPFTKQIEVNHGLSPAKLNDENIYTYFNDSSTFIVTVGDNYQECKVPGTIPINERVTLGNGKMVAFTPIYTHFSILDFKNCSTHSLVDIDDGITYYYDGEKSVVAVIPYYDTFDVYSKSGSGCTPCRYNDKGQRVEVNNTLKPELTTGEYFIESMNNMTGGGDGYFQGSSNDNTAVVRILDLNYKVSKEIHLNGKHEAHSLTHKHITICTSVNTCPEDFFSECPSTKCHLLDWNLNKMSATTMHAPDKSLSFFKMYISNLENYEAIAALEYSYTDSLIQGTSHQDVYIQQIHANGEVEPAIRFGRFHVDSVSTYPYVSSTGEYCVMVQLHEKGWILEDHDTKGLGKSLIKCVNASTAKNN